MKLRSLIVFVLALTTLLPAQTIIGYTSFEEPSAGGQYVGSTTESHALTNNEGQAAVVYTSVGGEMGFSAYYTNTLSDVGLTDGDYIGVTTYSPDGNPFPDGSQAYQLQDTDGKVTVTLDELTFTEATTVNFAAHYFVKEDGWESADFIKLWLTIDGSTEVILLNTEGSDIDDLGIEGSWRIATAEVTPSSSLTFHFELQSNAANEAIWVDNVIFTTGGSIPHPPVANAGPDQTVLFDSPVYLNASGSTDPDNNIESYLWTQISGTNVTLSGASTANAMFIAPATVSDLSFELLVTDDTDLESRDTVNIAVREPQDSKLIISEYLEGASNNKAIELYNVTNETVNLSGYIVKTASNGGGWASYELPLSGTLAAKGVYVIGNPSAVQAILDVSDTTHSVTYFNGNDAVGLFLNGVLVDVFGDPTSSTNFSVAGVSGAAAEHTIIRKPEILEGNTNWAVSAGTDADNSEWIVMDQDYFGDLGTHTAGPQAYTINNIEVATAFPQSGSEIELKANVIPGESSPAPSSVKLYYGTGGTQANSVDMFLESGTVYATAIPSLADGNLLLEYYIQASNGGSSSKTSVRTIMVAGTPTPISDIHANIQTLDGQIRTIEGVVTIGAGALRDDRTSAYLQDNSGRGLNIYAETFHAELERGVKARMVGEVDLYYTTVELKDFNYRVISTGEDLPAPVAVSVAGANSSALEGTLAKVTGTLSKIQTFSSSKNLILKDGSDSTIVKVWPTTGIDTDALTIGILHAITGVGSKYSDEYQLLVGYAEDIDPTVATGETDAVASFALNAPYPNPFNPVTTLEYSLDRGGRHTLSVYDLTGRRISTLYSGYAEPGLYRLSWDAADFTSGIYFIRLEAADRIATRKVVLIK